MEILARRSVWPERFWSVVTIALGVALGAMVIPVSDFIADARRTCQLDTVIRTDLLRHKSAIDRFEPAFIRFRNDLELYAQDLRDWHCCNEPSPNPAFVRFYPLLSAWEDEFSDEAIKTYSNNLPATMYADYSVTYLEIHRLQMNSMRLETLLIDYDAIVPILHMAVKPNSVNAQGARLAVSNVEVLSNLILMDLQSLDTAIPKALAREPLPSERQKAQNVEDSSISNASAWLKRKILHLYGYQRCVQI